MTVMSKTKKIDDEEEEQQHQGQESDDEMDWRGEEEGGNTGQEVEMEGAEAEDVEMEGTGTEEAEMEEATVWSIWDLYHGLAPHGLIKGWKCIFGASTYIAQYMVDRFASSIKEYGCT